MNHLDFLKRQHKQSLNKTLYIWESLVPNEHSNKKDRIVGFIFDGCLIEVFGGIYHPDNWKRLKRATQKSFKETRS